MLCRRRETGCRGNDWLLSYHSRRVRFGESSRCLDQPSERKSGMGQTYSEMWLSVSVSFTGVGSSLSTLPSLMKLSSGRAAMEGREALATADERRLDKLTLSSGLGEGAECDESVDDAIVLGESAQRM